MQRKHMTTKNVLLGLALGCMAGGLVVLFAAPQSGTQTRQLIQEKGGEVIDKSAKTLREARIQVENSVTGIRQRAGLGIVRLGNQIGSQLLGIKD
jgi:gas vesicle protein